MGARLPWRRHRGDDCELFGETSVNFENVTSDISSKFIFIHILQPSKITSIIPDLEAFKSL